jgi:[ribosomal protein S5]-alanine N-acetyltransferase
MDILPVLRTTRLVLRPLDEADASEIARLCADKAIAAGTLTIPHPYTLEDARKWLAMDRERSRDGRSLVWGITELEGGVLAGTVGLNPDPAHDRAELGYWIGVAFWGRGYASEAAERVLEYALAEAGLNRVYASHYPWNVASGRVLEKVGMRREGVLKQHIKKWGKYEDAVFYGLTRDEYGRARGTRGEAERDRGALDRKL